jgi:glucose/arabinose dehydrogenase
MKKRVMKRLRTLLLAAICSQPSAAMAMTPPASPIAHWALDEGAGSVAANSAAPAYDGTLTGTPTWTTGRLGSALFFDGSDYVEFGNITQLNGAQTITLTAWIKRFAAGSVVALGMKESAFQNLGIETRSDGTVRLNVSSGAAAYGAFSLNDTNWHHIALVFDGTRTGNANRLKGYLDGAQVPLTYAGTIPAAVTTHPSAFRLGRFDNAFSQGFIDDVWLHPRAIALSEIQAHGPVLPDLQPPTISITAPAQNATVSGDVVITTDAADNVGVRGVQFLLDGENLGAEDTGFPYSISWHTTYSDNGLHTLAARARDAAENSATASIDVLVSNPPPTDLVAGYAFDEGAGASAADASGHGLSGTLLNGPAWAQGIYGGALSFDGADDYVDLSDPPALRMTGSMTISAWINSSSFPFDDAAIVSRRAADQTGFQLDTTVDQGPRGIGFKLTSSAGANMMRYGATAMQANSWYHIAGVYDAAARTMNVYLNGVLDNGALVGTITSSQQYSTEHVDIGRRAGSSGFEFAGRVDDVRIYNRALTALEIQTDMNTPLSGGNPSDPNPPTVSITFPAAGAFVNDIITITADAADDVGVVGVRFFVDGAQVGLEDFDSPYGADWDTRTVSNGTHVLSAIARDAAGNMTTSANVPVTVANSNFFQNEILATGFDLPTNIEFLPDGRMLVGELAGVIKMLPPPYTQPDATPFLHITNIGSAGVQQGIYDIALDPSFATNHRYYVFYTAGNPNHDRLSRFTANSALDGTIPGSELILYEDPQNANAEHHGGAVAFGNDGKIYFTTGEHFNPPDAQNLSSPRGKLHRINPDGTVPADNPFHDGAGPHVDSIWALGLRNPFRACFDAPTNRLLIGDVGGNDYSTAQEEVDLGARGANYGWPNCELGDCGNPAYTPALYAYAHNGRDASITGGFVYHGSQFPSSYQGSYFFADYTQNWIRRLTFDANGNVNGVFNFEPADGSVDGPYGDIVYLAEGPDGALYYVDLGYSDIGGSFGVSKIHRIRYVQSNLPPIAVASANPTHGPPPLTVLFSSAGSLDPEQQPITFFWTFGDGGTSTAENPTHIYTQAGQYVARLAVSDNVNTTLSTPITISVGTPPSATILSPQDGAFFIAGDLINFSGSGTDADDGTLPASAFRWNIDFLHEGHVHPGTPITGVTSGSFTIPTSGHDFSGNTRYRITLTVSDSDGLTDVKTTIIWPTKVNLSFGTAPPGLTLYLDGVATVAPFVHDALINFNHSIEARNQSTPSTIYTFASWSDGGPQTHTIAVPATDHSYTATYDSTPNNTPITIGETTVFSDNDGGNGNLLLVQDATLTQAATLQSLSFYVTAASGSLRLGLYDASGPGGGPGALKAQTSAFNPVVGWNTANVVAPVSLPAGNYWLAYLPSSNGLNFAVNFNVGSFRYAGVAFGPMPAVFPAIAGQGTTHWSLYGTLTGSAPLVPPQTPCTGDLDGDLDTDLQDLGGLLANFGTPRDATLTSGDIDGDGDVDVNDLALLLETFGQDCR